MRLDGEVAHTKRGADVVSRRSESIACRVNHRHDSHGDLALRSLMAASAAVIISLHGEEISDFGILGVASGRLHLAHHELTLGTDSSDLALLLLFLDNIVLDLR